MADYKRIPRLPKSQRSSSQCQQFFIDDYIHPDLQAYLISDQQSAKLVEGCHYHSPFLRRLIQAHPEWVLASLTTDADAHFKILLSQITSFASVEPIENVNINMRNLRRARNAIALHIALMDCGGVWRLEQVVEALTQTADCAVQVALEIALRVEIGTGRLKEYATLPTSRHPLPQGERVSTTAASGLSLSPCGRGYPERTEERSISNTGGLVIIAMGKHGAGELNYSSDIDLIALFDPLLMPVSPDHEPQLVAIKIIQTVVKLLDQVTADGHVFRIDLRLRPDPASTPVALSINAAFTYYESVGQNWERAAMIKARTVAGDLALGEKFLSGLTPFIWRKYFDYAAIADIHAMKRQIYSHKGHETIAVEGHDIKLGRGGIREIEFFVQTQQLIYGGRRPQLRGRQTLEMLNALEADNWVTAAAVKDLTAAYVFLRTIEHRLQMLNDEQTQRLPQETPAFDEFALFCGYTTLEFRKTLLRHLRSVEHHYAHLFEEADNLGNQLGSLVFTGSQSDPETLETLKKFGFSNPEIVIETIKGWHFGRRKAITTQRARETLTELLPQLLAAFGKLTDPDTALHSFDAALSKMPAAVELFSILKQNKALLALFADLLGNAPRLAHIVATRPYVLDFLLDPDFTKPPEAVHIQGRITQLLSRAATFEDFLIQSRELAYAERFVVGAGVLSRLVHLEDAGAAHSLIAEAFLEQALREVRRDIEARYGRIHGAEMAILGMGKLGGREMTAASDLDLIIIYDAPENAVSDGKRSLSPADYYARTTQRLITALSSPMARGILYEIDLRLRPSGRKGPVAVSLTAFADYHATQAETWEHMALTRARCVAGNTSFFKRIESIIHSVITLQRNTKQVAEDISEMRRLVASEKGDRVPFDLKLAKGGLLDIEFITQFLVLTCAGQHPQIIFQNTGYVLKKAVELDVITKSDGTKLYEAWMFYSKFDQLLRLCLEDRFDPASTKPVLLKWLANRLDLPDFKMLTAHLNALQNNVRKIFFKIIG